MQKLKIQASIEAKMKNLKQKKLEGRIKAEMINQKAITGKGTTIVLNLIPFLKVTGRKWDNDSVAGEFLARLRQFLETTQVSYGDDNTLYIAIDGGLYRLQRTDWTINLTQVLREIGAPMQFVNADLIKNLYPKIVEVFKGLDPDYKPVSQLLE